MKSKQRKAISGRSTNWKKTSRHLEMNTKLLQDIITSHLFTMRLISADEEVTAIYETIGKPECSLEISKSTTSFDRPALEFLGKDFDKD